MRNQRRLNKKDKLAQEEIVGFVIIVILVSVGLLILLSFLIKPSKNEAVQDYAVNNFIQASMQYTSDCESPMGFLSVQDLIVSCQEGVTCLDGRNSCDVLNETLKGIIESGWNIKEGSAVKGYQLDITLNGNEMLDLTEGNQTRTDKGAFQDFPSGSDTYEVSLDVYY